MARNRQGGRRTMTARQVEIYTSGWCGYCHMARSLLQSLGCTFVEHDVDRDRERRREMVDRTGRHTVPQVLVDGRPLGGFTDIAKLHAAGLLLPLLRGDRPAGADDPG